eukprot:symbB.v1.2.031323.t1/scaffold3625.1/size53071/3
MEQRAVTEAYVLTDDEFLQRARQQEVLDGSTLILGRGEEARLHAFRLSEDHKPIVPLKQKRIEAIRRL